MKPSTLTTEPRFSALCPGNDVDMGPGGGAFVDATRVKPKVPSRTALDISHAVQPSSQTAVFGLCSCFSLLLLYSPVSTVKIRTLTGLSFRNSNEILQILEITMFYNRHSTLERFCTVLALEVTDRIPLSVSSLRSRPRSGERMLSRRFKVTIPTGDGLTDGERRSILTIEHRGRQSQVSCQLFSLKT